VKITFGIEQSKQEKRSLTDWCGAAQNRKKVKPADIDEIQILGGPKAQEVFGGQGGAAGHAIENSTGSIKGKSTALKAFTHIRKGWVKTGNRAYRKCRDLMTQSKKAFL